MANAPQKNTELIEHYFRELEQPKRSLSKWELDFFERMKDIFDRSGYLTDGQWEKLHEIYEQKTA